VQIIFHCQETLLTKEEIPKKIMTEIKGHFEKGLWMADKEPVCPVPDTNAFDKRFSEATKSVISSIDDVMKVTHDLVTTEEGKKYIEKTLKDSQVQIQKSFDGIITRVKDEVQKTVKPAK
jgi:hypothetical protein